MFRSTLIAAVVPFALFLGGSVPSHAQDAKPLDAKVIDAWKKLKAEPGWYQRTDKGGKFTEAKPKGTAIPAFRWSAINTPREGIAKLPAPGTAFALIIDDALADDVVVKQLGRFTNIQVLDLSNTAVTDVGLKTVAGLKNLEILMLKAPFGSAQRGKDLSPDGIVQLQRSLPRLKLSFPTK